MLICAHIKCPFFKLTHVFSVLSSHLSLSLSLSLSHAHTQTLLMIKQCPILKTTTTRNREIAAWRKSKIEIKLCKFMKKEGKKNRTLQNFSKGYKDQNALFWNLTVSLSPLFFGFSSLRLLFFSLYVVRGGLTHQNRPPPLFPISPPNYPPFTFKYK